MNIPVVLRILGQDVDVIYPYVFTERADGHGIADPDTNKIMLADQDNGNPLKESQIAEHLLHEIIHFVSWVATGNIRLCDDEAKHAAVSKILFQIIRDNDLDFREPRAGARMGVHC
jgi:hypothetical protein